MRRTATVALVLVAGCGGGDDEDGDGEPATPAQARACLMDAGYTVTGGSRSADDADAPDHELVIAGRGPGAFIAFYDRLSRAERYEPALRRDAARFKGVVERHGRVTIVWVRPPGVADQARVRRCLR